MEDRTEKNIEIDVTECFVSISCLKYKKLKEKKNCEILGRNERENRCCHWIDISAGCTLIEAATTTAGIFLGYVGNIFFMIYVSFDWLGRSKSE